jgi:hypothetical protein
MGVFFAEDLIEIVAGESDRIFIRERPQRRQGNSVDSSLADRQAAYKDAEGGAVVTKINHYLI